MNELHRETWNCSSCDCYNDDLYFYCENCGLEKRATPRVVILSIALVLGVLTMGLWLYLANMS